MDFVSEPIKTPHYINNNMTNFEFDVGFIKSPGCLNTTGDKIQIELNFINSDKATVIVFGDHNGSQFIVMITVWYIDMHCTIQNIIGSLGVASVSKTADGNIVLRCNTNKYGTCTVIASVPINYVIFAN